MTTSSLEGWLTVNNKLRYCCLRNGKLDIATNEKLDSLEYSIHITKIVDIVRSNDKEFTLLPQNAPQLNLMSENLDTFNIWKNAMIDGNNFEHFHQNIQKMINFDLVREIGEGYCGRVYLVHRKSDKKLLALKLIDKKKLINPLVVQRMITERNIMIQNKYPFITKMYSAFQTESHLIFALEYVGGGDLQYHLDKGLYLSQKQIKLYLAELVLTLEHLHKMGIIFRDLKPSNILIGKDGHIKLTDFGLSKSIVGSGETKTLCGTHDYLSPEMLNGAPYNFSVDWWAFGVIAYRLICGILPFNNENLSKLFDKIIDCNYRIPIRIDQESRNLISGILKKNPSDRLTLEQIKSHQYFNEIDWQKVYKKEYKMDFIPYCDELNCAYNFKKYENDYDSNDSCLLCASSTSYDQYGESDTSFVKNFSFYSNKDDFSV